MDSLAWQASAIATNWVFMVHAESALRYMKCMAVLNIIAAVLLALMPALEPCRLHSMFGPPNQESTAAKPRHACGHRHSHDTELQEPQTCPDCPDACSHLNDADGLPAIAATSVLIPALPCIWAPHVLHAPALALSCAWQYQHPPQTGVALVGISNIRI